MGNSQTAKAINLGYAFWALLIGLIISNTIGTPRWMMPAVRTEYYIKTGLVILGAEILFNRIVEFGPYGLAIAWLVTPIVIIFMYLFGTRVLNMQQKSLVMVVATSTSVCGVSAAIAAAAACKAKKNELTLAVGMTLIFTKTIGFKAPS
ncbi:putative sulfate exporter family transporter [Moorena sp. SIO4A1]|uniref:putative sulfate exporter family transporter n=1 Tax=Moorena sp. SIO4A1 TaxID=2607835 RepID=UPI0025CCF617|nr:putative sulfate exporter family transporter [Moorena sp. SIO4A1]